MTTPLPRAASDAPHLGLLIREHRGSLRRFGPVAVGAFLIIVSIPSYHSSSGSDDIGARLVFMAVGIACFAWYFFFGGRGAYAELFQYGFSISRVGTTTTGQWENIASVRHLVKRQFYVFFFLPVAWTTNHIYIITLTNGLRLRVSSAHFSNAHELGETILRMSAKAALARHASSSASHLRRDDRRESTGGSQTAW